jgi:hypothetical protein
MQDLFSFLNFHILKCIQDNWLNQKDCDQTFIYPQPSPVYRPSDSDCDSSVGSCSTALSSSSSSSIDMCLQSHSSSGAVNKPTAEQSHLPSQLVTVFRPLLINDVVMMPVIMPLQVTSSEVVLRILRQNVLMLIIIENLVYCL